MKDENFMDGSSTEDENCIQVHKVDGTSMKDENSTKFYQVHKMDDSSTKDENLTKSIKWTVRPRRMKILVQKNERIV